MAMDKLFKGILQYKSTDSFTKEAGYIYFVREFVDGVATGDAEVWFGTRKYGSVEATKLADLEQRLAAAEGDITTIKGQIGEWVADMGTIATVVASHETAITANDVAIKANASAITAEENARKEAISALTDDMNGKFALKADASALTKAVSDLENAIGVAQGAAVQEATAYTEDEIAKVVSAYTAADEAMGNRIQALEGSIGENGDTAKAIKAAQDAADAAQADVDALYEVVGDGFTKESTVATQLAAVKETADAAAKNADFTAHTADTKVHVTEELQTKWNKAAADIDAFLFNETGATEALDSIKEIQAYIETHGTEAKNMQTAITANDVAIKANASAITAEENARKEAISALTDDMNGKFALKADASALTTEENARKEAISALTDDMNGKFALKADASALTKAVSDLESAIGVAQGAAETTAKNYTDDEIAKIDDKIAAIDHRVYYGGDDAE